MNPLPVIERRRQFWQKIERALSPVAGLFIIAAVPMGGLDLLFAGFGVLQVPFPVSVVAPTCALSLLSIAIVVVARKKVREHCTALMVELVKTPAAAEMASFPKIFLFLRSFEDDQFIGSRRKGSQIVDAWEDDEGHCHRIESFPRRLDYFERDDWELESSLSRELEKHGIVVALGNQSYQLAEPGAIKVPIDSTEWQHAASRLMDWAQIIICVPGCTPGVRWEVEKILGSPKHAAKTILVNPGNSLRQERKPDLFDSEAVRLSSPGFDAPQVGFWNAIQSQYRAYNFPKFEPFGEWFMTDCHTKSLRDRERWDTKPAKDLLLISERNGLLELDPADRVRLRKYKPSARTRSYLRPERTDFSAQ
jgi:hypothetical protein